MEAPNLLAENNSSQNNGRILQDYCTWEVDRKDIFFIASTQFRTLGFAEVKEELQSLVVVQELKKKLCMAFSAEERNL